MSQAAELLDFSVYAKIAAGSGKNERFIDRKRHSAFQQARG
jgi:hypothetical protein